MYSVKAASLIAAAILRPQASYSLTPPALSSLNLWGQMPILPGDSTPLGSTVSCVKFVRSTRHANVVKRWAGVSCQGGSHLDGLNESAVRVVVEVEEIGSLVCEPTET